MILAKRDTEVATQFGQANSNYERQETLQTGFSDDTSIENIYDYGEQLCTDNLQFRDWIKEEFEKTTWAASNNTVRDIVIELYIDDPSLDEATNNSNKVTHLITTGQAADVPAASAILSASYAKHHVKEVMSCRCRAESSTLYDVIGTYLALDDAKDFFQTVRDLYIDFKEQAVRGTLDGNVGVGLFDYIESTTGTVYENAGLDSKGYTLNQGTLNDFVTALMEVLREGNYEK